MEEVTIALFVSASVLVALAMIAVSLRLYVRIFMIKNLGPDDYLMITALAFYIVAEAMIFDATAVTQGKDILGLIEVLPTAMKAMYVGEIFYVLAVWSLKLSIGAFLLRLVQSRVQKYIIYGVLTCISIFSTIYLGLVIFQCKPVDHFWNILGAGKCLSGRFITKTSYVHAALTGSSDLIFATIPVFLVWRLQMRLAMKISIAGLLGLGAVAGITTFIRMPYVKALEEATPVDFFNATAKLAIWTCIEPGVGIFVGSLATLRPLFKKILGGSEFDSSNAPSGYNSHSNPKVTPIYRSSSKNAPRADPSHPLDTLSPQTRKFTTTTVVEGSLTKNGKRWCGAGKNKVGSSKLDDNESEEELNRSKSKDLEAGIGGIQKTVGFNATSSVRDGPSPTKEKSFGGKGGFY